MIDPRHRTDEAMGTLQEQWKTGAVRIEHALPTALAARLLEGLREEPHGPQIEPDPTHGYQLWRFAWVPEVACQHDLCELGRWLWTDGAVWASAVTGRPLGPDPSRQLVSDRFAKGSFFEAYDDHEPGRAVAFQLHLAPSDWPQSWGGHLQLLDGPDGPVREQRAPGWNVLELFDVSRPGAWRRGPVITEHLQGYVVSGWWWVAPRP